MHSVNKIVTEYYKDSNSEKEQCIKKLKDIQEIIRTTYQEWLIN